MQFTNYHILRNVERLRHERRQVSRRSEPIPVAESSIVLNRASRYFGLYRFEASQDDNQLYFSLTVYDDNAVIVTSRRQWRGSIVSFRRKNWAEQVSFVQQSFCVACRNLGIPLSSHRPIIPYPDGRVELVVDFVRVKLSNRGLCL